MEIASIFLRKILSASAQKGASSLLLSVGSFPMAKITGQLSVMDDNILTVDFLNEIIKSVLDESEIEILKKHKSISTVKIISGSFRFRINIFYQKKLPSISFNYIPGVIRDLDDLDLPPILKNAVNLKSGLLIIAGPNDSGKTSTAASFLENINKNQKKRLMTLEDPIEYLFINKKSIVEQRQIGQDVDSYMKGLEFCLDEDIDCLYINNLRTDFNASIPLILNLASGNCLVILEMNAENSIMVIEKILSIKNMSRESVSYSFADNLLGIISQKLIPGIGGKMYMAKEILVVNSAVESLIREGRINQLESIIQTSRGEGMSSMQTSIRKLVEEGKISQKDFDSINN